MAWYHITLISAAIIAVALAWRVPRAVIWLGLGAISYVISAAWHNAGLPYATQFGAATNLVICYLFICWAEQRWEMRLLNCFHMMLLIDLLYIFGVIHDHLIFAATLEIINLAAILLVAGTGILDWIARHGHRYGDYNRRWTYPVHNYLRTERSGIDRPFWQTGRR